jgi:wyosine [tRNA(Phe)-imidazoG37] synthetase (radical SAM superfamily)
MRHATRRVFGPVASRRLGHSLGVDPVPFKACNQSCVYCQLGRTRSFVRRRRSFFSTTEIFSEIATALDRDHPDGIDWITFVGSGETTLFAGLGPLIRFVKSMSDIPVAVITNGSLLGRADVRRELRTADAVLPSVDAGSPDVYHRINRPHPDLSFDRHIDGLVAFRDIYHGRLWVETMLIAGVNDTPEALTDLVRTLRRIGPDEIHLSAPTRPPAEAWVRPPSRESVELAAGMLGTVAEVLVPGNGTGHIELDGDIDRALVDILTRHPLREDEIQEAVATEIRARTEAMLGDLVTSGGIRIVERLGDRFWCPAEADFPDPREVSKVRAEAVIQA